MTSSPPAKRFDWRNLGARALSATLLIPAVVAAVWLGGWLFAAVIVAAAGVMAREWGLMSAPRSPRRVALVIFLAVLAAVFVAQLHFYKLSWGALGVGALVAAFAAKGAVERRADAGYGVIYIAPSCIALVWLRGMPQGVVWTLMVFVVAWSADIFAYVAGNVFKGPKLWPRISPNKTWSGFIGGLAAAMLAAALLSWAAGLRLSWPLAALTGLVGGLATMAGDLWESSLKRRFGVKDSGDLIPGHGGLLDRVDGLLFAVIVLAAARLVVHWGLAH
jgi:phosphatidate cytidylyltransferase